MGRRPPIQLRGSAGFAPASRAPDVKVVIYSRVALVKSGKFFRLASAWRAAQLFILEDGRYDLKARL
jgi:hypothetical protein